MKTIEVPLEVASSTHRPWAQWADGQWRRVPDLASDLNRYSRFQSAMTSWTKRNGCTGHLTRGEDGSASFRITARSEPVEQFVIWMTGESGWLRIDRGRIAKADHKDEADRFDMVAAQAILSLIAALEAPIRYEHEGRAQASAYAVPVDQLYQPVRPESFRTLVVMSPGSPVIATTALRTGFLEAEL